MSAAEELRRLQARATAKYAARRADSLRHEPGSPCPITGEPAKHVFTNHAKAGIFNACASCEPRGAMAIGTRLAALNAERKARR